MIWAMSYCDMFLETADYHIGKKTTKHDMNKIDKKYNNIVIYK